jgi:hypothetical protein
LFGSSAGGGGGDSGAFGSGAFFSAAFAAGERLRALRLRHVIVRDFHGMAKPNKDLAFRIAHLNVGERRA